ncbi:MAG: YbaN family protein [Pseudomonadales bacterium]|nr:YbaN family protein [Pseudomonadales bacterium]
MKDNVVRIVYISLGWLFVAIGAVGVVLPILPTTPFLILSLALFAKSSPRFHEMLLNNRWVGASLREWEETRTVSRTTKKRATTLTVISFSVSISILHDRLELQLFLITLATILMISIWRLKE